MNYQTIFFIMVILIVTSCGVSTKPTFNEELDVAAQIEMPYKIMLPEKAEGMLKISMIADTVKYIRLETKKESLINKVFKIVTNDSLIIISDLRKLLLFKKDGSFLRQIGKNGKGPGEYIRIFNFLLNNDTIYLSSSGKRSIMKFTLDGQYLGEQRTNMQLTHTSFTPDGHVASYKNDIGQVYFLNSQSVFVDSLKVKYGVDTIGSRKYVVYDAFDTYFQPSPDKLLFYNYLNDTVWDITNRSKKAHIVFNLKQKLLPENCQVDNFNGDFDKYFAKAKPYQKVNLLETSSYVYVFQRSWSEEDLNAIYQYRISDGMTKRYNGPFILDDLISGLELKIRSFYSIDNTMISVINPVDLLEKQKETVDKSPKQSGYEKWEAGMRNLRYDDNPIIAFIELKQVPR